MAVPKKHGKKGNDLLFARASGVEEKTEAQRQKIVAEFKQLHGFLEEQERLLLAQLQNLDDEVNDHREKHLVKLLEELSSLDNLIKEQEEKQKQPANEFLQDLRSILQRCNQNKFVDPVAFPPELKQQIEQLSGMCFFPDVKKCIDAVFSGDQEKKANVLENMRTVPTLLLSKNYQAWQNYGGGSFFHHTNVPPASNQLHCWSSILGVERITSGTHSWLMDIRNEQFWAVGVAKESLRGRNDFSMRPEEGIWAVGRSLDGQFYPLNPTTPLWQFRNALSFCVSPKYIMPRRIHVILNYEEGSVTFVNPDSNSTIFTFNGISFSGEKISSWCGTGLA